VDIIVSDEGPGIPTGLRSEIFEPFYSTRTESAGGLGLAITRRIVQEAGGEIRVSNRETGGAEFAVRLAAAEDPPASSQECDA
jgi:C4-dicarboxylate-specific signal transduction histidine kinase